MRIENIKNSDLDALDINELGNYVISDEHRGYFLEKSGNEHYRLLSYLSLQSDNNKFLDIGTFKGCSALAMSKNPKSIVNSFNLYDELDLSFKPTNINFYVDDIMKSEYKEMILSSSYIFLDTFHDGIFENQFYNYLDEIQYKGLLILDDIIYFSALKTFWETIQKEKYDISHIGHWAGTGLVYFN